MTSRLQVKATREIEESEELTFSYGERSSTDFFVHYGFVPLRNPRDDVVLFEDVDAALDWYALESGLPLLMGREDEEKLIAALQQIGAPLRFCLALPCCSRPAQAQPRLMLAWAPADQLSRCNSAAPSTRRSRARGQAKSKLARQKLTRAADEAHEAMERRVEAERAAVGAVSADASGSAATEIGEATAASDSASLGGDGGGAGASASASTSADAPERSGSDDGSSASEATASGTAKDRAARAQAPAQTSGRGTNDPRRLAVTAGSYITPEIISMFGCAAPLCQFSRSEMRHWSCATDSLLFVGVRKHLLACEHGRGSPCVRATRTPGQFSWCTCGSASGGAASASRKSLVGSASHPL